MCYSLFSACMEMLSPKIFEHNAILVSRCPGNIKCYINRNKRLAGVL